MNRETLFDAITDIREDLIMEAEAYIFHKPGVKIHWQRWAAMAAGLALVLSLGAFGLSRLRMGGSGSFDNGGLVPGGDMTGSSDGGGGYGGYTSYAGGVLPLTALGETDGITAERHVSCDFSSYAPERERWPAAAEVADAYTLTNGTDTDRTLTLLYPALLSYADRADHLPALTVDGAAVSPAIYAGPYAGGFQDAGTGTEGQRLNLASITSWEGWRDLLSDGRYQGAALAGTPEPAQPATVYRVYDYVVAPTDAVNPTLRFSFDMDYDKTAVLVYGSNGGSDDAENGWCSRVVGGLGSRGNTNPMYVILLGEDIGGYELQGYRNMGCEPGDEIEVSAAVERSETTLGEILRRLMENELERGRFGMNSLAEEPTVGTVVPRTLLFHSLSEMLSSYGVLNNAPAERYEFGRLEDLMSDSYVVKRVLYLAFDVTVPAGSGVEVRADMFKTASFHFPGVGGDPAMHGYDLFVSLGSTLDFTALSASVSGTEYIEPLENEFGFDPDAGISEVSLDPGAEHYWLQIRKTE